MPANFLNETLAAITDSGHQPSDIFFIGSRDTPHTCTWEEFQVMANFEYPLSSPCEIATDLVIVFKDQTFLERNENNSYEEWRHVAIPRHRSDQKKITRLHIDRDKESPWRTLAELNPDN